MLEKANPYIIGVGTALVDKKIIEPIGALPQNYAEIANFLKINKDFQISAGGSMANVMVTLARLIPHGSVRFLQRVGIDADGEYYKQQGTVN